MFEGARRRAEREHNDRAWLAWHTAAFSRVARLKPADLKKVQVRRAARREPQTWQQQLDIAKMWTAAFGGSIRKDH